jgi:hypothetical protein
VVGLRATAIGLGFVVDLVASLLSAGALGGILQSVLGLDADALSRTPLYLVTALALGLACTVGGGAVAGWMAGAHGAANGGAVGVLGIVLAVIMLDADGPLWLNAAGLLGSIPAGALGGRLATRGC